MIDISCNATLFYFSFSFSFSFLWCSNRDRIDSRMVGVLAGVIEYPLALSIPFIFGVCLFFLVCSNMEMKRAL